MWLFTKFRNFLLINLINIVIICITILNIFIIFSFTSIYISWGLSLLSIYITLIIIEWFFIIFCINNFYGVPIRNLVYNIKKALLTKEEIGLQKSINPNINYINNFFQQFLSSFKNIRSDFLKWKEIKWEVELAREIQEKLLNKKIILPPTLNIIAKSKPMWEIWWDSYDVIQNEDNYYIYIWDATWHWVWAWFIMVMVNALISSLTKIFVSWAQILVKVNETLKPRIKANLLMSLLLIRWDEKSKRLFMTWAGHEYLIIYKHKLQQCFKIKSWWLALWMIKDISKVTKEKEVEFGENDIIILYSDWITDSVNSKDVSRERFWEMRVINAIEKSSNMIWKNFKTARWVFNNISVELSKFMWYKHNQVDDITLVVIQYKSKDYEENNDFSDSILEDKSIMTEWRW
jgi:serine phosphatase RsbU (regulator of sigma subunit)